MAGAGMDASVETPDLRRLLGDLKEVEPRLATALRRELRQAGDEIIGAQQQELGSGDLRDEIAAGLRTRVTAGKTRQGVAIRSTGPRKGGANMARVLQMAIIRHPVFGTDTWVDQNGHPYFFKPVTDELRNRMTNRVDDALNDALRVFR